MRSVLPLLTLVLATSCALDRAAAFESLPDAAQDQYAKSEQFMTDAQKDRYLQARTQAERDALVDALNIEARLARYPETIRQSILAKEVVIGMDRAAVMFAWGPPDRIERKTGGTGQTWLYPLERQVRFEGDVVVEVVHGS